MRWQCYHCTVLGERHQQPIQYGGELSNLLQVLLKEKENFDNDGGGCNHWLSSVHQVINKTITLTKKATCPLPLCIINGDDLS